MTVTEKVELQNRSYDTVFLFKEGLFYKVYNEGIYHLQDYDYKISCRYFKCVDDFVASIGFPEKVFQDLKRKHKVESKDNFWFFKTSDVLSNYSLYLEWKSELVEKLGQGNVFVDENRLVEVVKNYPLAIKTPVDVFIWISEIQKKLL